MGFEILEKNQTLLLFKWQTHRVMTIRKTKFEYSKKCLEAAF